MREKYRLELHWDSIDKNRDNSCNLFGAYFFGPAIKNSNKINYPDKIVIDLTPQYSKILTDYYFVDLNWSKAEYKDNKVFLGEVTIVSDYINKVSNLQDIDCIHIDTEDHEEDVHMFNLVYKGKVVNSNGEEY